MKHHLLKQFMLHYAVSMSVILLLVAFVSILFFYRNVYQPLLGTAEIYELKGKVNSITIKTEVLDNASAALKQKTGAKPAELEGIKSPF